MIDSLPDNIKSKIIITSRGCWLFSGHRSSNGYQRLQYWGESHMAHIFVYRWFKPMTVENGRVYDHLCEVRNCCNPNHLQLVTQSVNCKRKFRRRKTI